MRHEILSSFISKPYYKAIYLHMCIDVYTTQYISHGPFAPVYISGHTKSLRENDELFDNIKHFQV